jgi:predicted DNA-binding protein (MmcQ/YjbR family)
MKTTDKATKETFFEYVKEAYDIEPDYPFADDFESAVFRHPENRKWFALFMARIDRRRLNSDEDGVCDVVNLKCDPFMIGSVLSATGVAPAYHMNKEHWISVLLDGSADMELLQGLIAMSYELTRPKVAKRKK